MSIEKSEQFNNIKSGFSNTVGVNKYHQLQEMNEKNPDNDFLLKIDKHKKIFQETFELSDKDLEMLMVMYRFNKATFEHSLRTISIINLKVHKPLEKGIVLADGIKKEVQDIKVFFRACLFHDIGKIAIPDFILSNRLKDSDWANYLLDLLNDEKGFQTIKNNLQIHSDQADQILEKLQSASSSSEIVLLLRDFDIRPCQIVPVKFGISNDESTALENDFNTSPELPLWSIVNKHEVESSNILASQGFEREASIVKDHGNRIPRETPTSSTSLKIGSRMSDVKDLIYLADVQEALLSRRDYKDPVNQVRVMAYLAKDAQKGKLDKVVTHLWLNDDMELLKLSKHGQKILEICKTDDSELNQEGLKLKKDLEKDISTIESFLNSLSVI